MKLSEKILKQLIVETLKEQEVVAGLSSALTSDEPAPKPLSDEENEAAEELLQILAGVLGASISAVADKEEPIAELTQHKALGNANRALAKQRRAAADKAKKEIIDDLMAQKRITMDPSFYDGLITTKPDDMVPEQRAAYDKSYQAIMDSENPIKQAEKLAGDLVNKNLLDLPIIKNIVAAFPLMKSALLALAGTSGQEVTLATVADLFNPATGDVI